MTTATQAARAASPPRLSDVFDPRANALNAFRLVLAGLVVVSHAWPLTGTGPDPSFGGQKLGSWAVVGFFLVSGFLITRSRLRRPAGRFYRDRFLRIYPGYLVAMAVTGFVVAPLSTLVTGRVFNPVGAASWFVHNLPLYERHFARASIPPTLEGLPYPIWNGPVWSLFFEAACYVAIGLAVTLVPRRALAPCLGVVALGLTAATAAVVHGEMTVLPIHAMALPAVLAFAVGGCAYLLQDRLVVDRRTVGLSLLGLAVVVAVGEAQTLGAWVLVLPVFWLANRMTLAHRVGTRHDISYGIYIYGWPVQTLLVLAAREHGWHLPIVVDIVLVLAVTLPLAWLSALLVEEPAQRLGSSVRG